MLPKFYLRKLNNILYFVAVLSIIFVGDFLSSRYGTGVVFKKYSELSFDFEVILVDGEISIFNPKGKVYLVTADSYFPSGKQSNPSSFKDDVFIEDILAFSVFDSSLFVLVKGVDNKKFRIKIDSTYPKEGFLKDYEFVEEGYLESVKWQELDRNFFLALQLNWSKIFWGLNILSIVFIYFLYRKNVNN